MSSFREQLIATAKGFLAARNSLDAAAVETFCSPTSTHSAGPNSVKSPTRTRAEYTEFNKMVFSNFTSYHAEPTDIVVDEQARKVILYLDTKGTSVGGDYTNNYVIKLTMTEDGKLVQDEYDFVDSHAMMQWLTRAGMLPKES